MTLQLITRIIFILCIQSMANILQGYIAGTPYSLPYTSYYYPNYSRNNYHYPIFFNNYSYRSDSFSCHYELPPVCNKGLFWTSVKLFVFGIGLIVASCVVEDQIGPWIRQNNLEQFLLYHTYGGIAFAIAGLVVNFLSRVIQEKEKAKKM